MNGFFIGAGYSILVMPTELIRYLLLTSYLETLSADVSRVVHLMRIGDHGLSLVTQITHVRLCVLYPSTG